MQKENLHVKNALNPQQNVTAFTATHTHSSAFESWSMVIMGYDLHTYSSSSYKHTQEGKCKYLKRHKWVRLLWLPDLNHARGHLTQSFVGMR